MNISTLEREQSIILKIDGDISPSFTMPSKETEGAETMGLSMYIKEMTTDVLYKLRNLYYINPHAKIGSYLSTSDVNTLLECTKELRKQFPDEVLILDTVLDPDGVMPSEVAVFIQTSHDSDDALNLLSNFDNWLMKNTSREFMRKVTFNLEYV